MPERLTGVFTTRRYTNPRLPLPLSLGTTYHLHLGLIGKRVVVFLLELIELFTALHEMQTRSSDQNTVCRRSVRLPVCLSVKIVQIFYTV